TGIDREQAARVIEETVLAPDPQPVVIPTEEIIPVLTEQDIDTALLEARAITGSSIVLRAGENEITFTPEQLVEAYIGTTVTEGIPGIAHSFDPEVINRFLEPLRSQYEASPVDARFEIVGDEVRIIRGSFGTRIDENEAVAQLLQA